LRAADSNRDMITSKLKQLIRTIGNNGRSPKIITYSRAPIDTDYSIHIIHDSDKVEGQGSPLGFQPATALKAFGLANHSVWVRGWKMQDSSSKGKG